MSGIKNIPGGELVYAAATFAVAIAQEYDLDDINILILAGFFSAVGDGLAVIAAKKSAFPDTGAASVTEKM